jgi:1,4-dihydroxy-2-naphthoyl-CoA hydrolase
MSDPAPPDFSEILNAAMNDGWMGAMGVRIVRASRDEVTAEIEVGPAHLQAYGIVHGGVHAGIIESIASIGAALDAMPHGRSVVGLENHTSFLRAVRGGKLHAVAKPLARGRRSQVWEGSVYDDQGKLAASGRVRLLVLEPDAELAGSKAGLPERGA